MHGDEVHWDDIAGLESAKYSLKEAVVYPFLRPDLFRGYVSQSGGCSYLDHQVQVKQC